ncbi:MAG: hypothetical protein OHK0029_25130 [Armatimonadaceae bacterium]
MQDFAGFLLTILYALAGSGTFLIALRERKRGVGILPVSLLVLLSLVLWLFFIQRTTDTFGSLTDGIRRYAYTGGWYAERREIQALIVRTIPAVAVALIIGIGWLIRRDLKRYLPVLLALSYMGGLGALRAVSLHQLDAMFRHQIYGISIATGAEIAGLLLSSLTVVWLGWGRMTFTPLRDKAHENEAVIQPLNSTEQSR